MSLPIGTRAIALSVVLLMEGTAVAEPQTPAPGAAPADGRSSDKVEEARKHFDIGVQLYSEANYEGALVEFLRANEIAPAYRIQYSLGLIYRQLNNYAAATKAYESYLRDGGNQIARERRAEVERELTMLRTRVARVEINVNVAGADVFIDDVPVGKAPLDHTVVVDPGRRKLSASKAGFAPATQIVTIATGDADAIRLNLVDLTRHEVKLDAGPRNRTIAAWSATGALTATAVVFGVLALGANSDLSNERATFGADPSQLSHDSGVVKRWSYLCDGFSAAALVSAGLATFFTVKMVKHDRADSKDQVDVSLGPTGVAFTASF